MQYPHLHPTDGRDFPDVPHELMLEIVKACKQVEAQTVCTGWYHQGLRGIQWHIGEEPGGGPCLDVLFQRDRYLPINVQETIGRIQMATNTSRSEKDRQMVKQRERAKIKKDYEQACRASAMAPELKSRLRYNKRKYEAPRSQRVFQLSDR